MRLINADKIQYAKDWVVTDKIPKVGGYNAKAIYRVTKEEIDAIPTVDAVPVKHGRWIDIDSETYTWKIRCSNCGHERSMMSTGQIYPMYCENCGTRMDWKESDNEKTD